MSFAQVQALKSGGKGTAGSTVTATYGSATTSGNLLVAGLAIQSATLTPTFPAGWTKRVTITNTSGSVATQIWDYTNNAGGITTVVVSGLTTRPTVLIVGEFSGELAANPQDVSATATGTSSNSVATGTTAALNQSGELGIAFCAEYDINQNVTFANPTNTYSIPTGGTANHPDNVGGFINAVWAQYLNVSGSGAQSTTVTVTGASGTNPYTGGLSTYKPSVVKVPQVYGSLTPFHATKKGQKTHGLSL